jgi:hypothetical protein
VIAPTTPRGTRYASTRLPASREGGSEPSSRVQSAAAIRQYATTVGDQLVDLAVSLRVQRLALVESQRQCKLVPPLRDQARDALHRLRALERRPRRPVARRGVGRC